ncbi:MAG: hypothetical protein AAF570_02235 [Bacteroidota bacterium]
MRHLKIQDYQLALYNLMLKTHVLNQKGWANLLRVSEQAVSQWLKKEDFTIPSPKNLYAIVEYFAGLVDDDENINQILQEFNAMADLPMRHDSEAFKRFKVLRVSDYFLKPLFERAKETISRLPSPVKKAALKSRIREHMEADELLELGFEERKLQRFYQKADLVQQIRDFYTKPSEKSKTNKEEAVLSIPLPEGLSASESEALLPQLREYVSHLLSLQVKDRAHLGTCLGKIYELLERGDSQHMSVLNEVLNEDSKTKVGFRWVLMGGDSHFELTGANSLPSIQHLSDNFTPLGAMKGRIRMVAGLQ